MRIIDIFSMKPFDSEGVRDHIEKCGGKVIVVEEHYENGAAYEAVCSAGVGKINSIKHLFVSKIPGSAKPVSQL